MSKEIRLATVNEHNKATDLWIVIDNKVYDVTKFRLEHPGGEESLVDEAGRDATKAFNDVGHSSEAREMLKKYYIGDLAAADIKKKSPISCRHVALALGAAFIGISLVYVIRRGVARN
ncbi:cytochrome b5 isoform X1 [Drosophila simulans]|uniref:Cytochrome b5 n=1 Tax=Drosophila mauritiana TaxID=7226 RepID=A0A6P8KQ08_DROMA|nr:cytochrome b5 isoform X1 [Drosophila simulans]XP_033171128.1 cytochrome b5 isoform X1 [Drosophila mauritiana]KMZ08439.1 uncharacterized protein Dsimw501_GD16200, isoform B [Drosophila simulans]